MFLKPIYFYVLALVFSIAFVINIILFINPKIASESIDLTNLILLLTTLACRFGWTSKSIKQEQEEPLNSKIIIGILSLYSVGIVAFGITHKFFPEKAPLFYTTSLGTAAMVLLFSGNFLRMAWLHIKNEDHKL